MTVGFFFKLNSICLVPAAGENFVGALGFNGMRVIRALLIFYVLNGSWMIDNCCYNTEFSQKYNHAANKFNYEKRSEPVLIGLDGRRREYSG